MEKMKFVEVEFVMKREETERMRYVSMGCVMKGEAMK